MFTLPTRSEVYANDELTRWFDLAPKRCQFGDHFSYETITVTLNHLQVEGSSSFTCCPECIVYALELDED